MAEHQPPNALVWAMAAFLAVMTVAAALFWLFTLLLPGGAGAVMAMIGPAGVAFFATFHIPAAIIGILLLRWHRPALPPIQRVALEASTLYFSLAVVVSVFLNYIAASLLDRMS